MALQQVISYNNHGTNTPCATHIVLKYLSDVRMSTSYLS
jgi:hypothetical protein